MLTLAATLDPQAAEAWNDALLALDAERVVLDGLFEDRIHDLFDGGADLPGDPLRDIEIERAAALALIAEAERRLVVAVEDATEWLEFVEAHRGEFSEPTRNALIGIVG